MENVTDSNCSVIVWIGDAEIAHYDVTVLALTDLMNNLGGLVDRCTKITISANGVTKEFTPLPNKPFTGELVL